MQFFGSTTVKTLRCVSLFLAVLTVCAALLTVGVGAVKTVPFKGIDVSKWQGSVNFNTAKNAGVDFVIMRCYATGKDTKFEEFYRGASDAGLWIGAYVYMYAKTEEAAAAEAAATIKALAGRHLDFPLFLDIEDGSLMSVEKSKLTSIALIELKAFEKAGYTVGIYTSQYFGKTFLEMNRLSSYYMWYAKWSLSVTNNSTETYQFKDQNPYQSNTASHVWQFSNGGDGKTYGASSKWVDLNYCYYDFVNGGRFLYPYTSVDPDDYPVPTRSISYKQGSTLNGLDVAWIQVTLRQLGYNVEVDGSFGPASKSAVVEFQKANGISTDGAVGPITRAALISKWKERRAKIGCPQHRYVKTSVVAPRCAADGYTVYTCEKCGATYNGDTVKSLGHLYDGGTVTPAGAFTDGYTVYTCTREGCGETYIVTIPHTGVRGDLNGDSSADMKDILHLRRIVAGLESVDKDRFEFADVRPDGDLNMKDVLALRRIVAGLEN